MYKSGGVSDLLLTPKSKKEKKQKSGKEDELKSHLSAVFSQTTSSAKKTSEKAAAVGNSKASDPSPKDTKRASKTGTVKKHQKSKVAEKENNQEKTSQKAGTKGATVAKKETKKKIVKSGKAVDTEKAKVKSSTEDKSPKKLKRKKSGEENDQDAEAKKARLDAESVAVAMKRKKKQRKSGESVKNDQKEEKAQEGGATTKGKSKKKKSGDKTNGDTSGEKESGASGEKLRHDPDDPDKVARTVFVGNLPTSTTLKELRKHFRKYGKVESARLRNVVPENPHMPRRAAAATGNFHPERAATNAFVVFTTPAEASAALASNGSVLGGHHLRVDGAATSKRHDHARSVFVGNLPFEVEEESLRLEFASCGEIENVRLIRDGPTGLGKGFGYILFQDAASVVVALRLHEASMFGRRVRVFRSVRKEKIRPQASGGDSSNTSRQRGSAVAGVLRRQQRSLAKPKPSTNDTGTWGLGGRGKNKKFRKGPTAAASKKRNMAEIFSHKRKQRTAKKSTK